MIFFRLRLVTRERRPTFLFDFFFGPGSRAPESILHWYGKMKRGGGGPGVLPGKILKFKVAKTPKF